MDENNFRKGLLELIEGGSAHISLERALQGIDPELLTVRPSTNLHSIYEEMEHIRIAQEDIIRYTLDEKWESPPWPEGYWPGNTSLVTEEDWSELLKNFRNDLEEAISLIKNPEIDLTSEIPHGEGRTYLRQILLIADHNAYHLGKIVDIRKALNNWE